VEPQAREEDQECRSGGDVGKVAVPRRTRSPCSRSACRGSSCCPWPWCRPPPLDPFRRYCGW